MALPILSALVRGYMGAKIADKLTPKKDDKLETAVNVVSAIKPKEQENRSLVPAEGISQDKMTILPPEVDKEKSIKDSMDVFRQILDNLITIKENVLGIKTGLSDDRKLELQKEKILAGQQLESRVESERLTGDEGEETKISIVQAAKKGLGMLGKLILGIFAFDVLRKLFKKFAPDLYGKIETGLKDMAKDFEESFLGGLAIDTIKNSANAIYKGIAGTYNLVVGLLSGDLEQAAKGADQFNESVMSALDNIMNPILALLEIGMRDDPDYERTKNIFQEGYKNYKAFMADIEESFRNFEIKPEVLEALSFDNIKKEIKKLGNELVSSFKQLFVDLKNFFSFDNIKRVITGEEKPIEQQINEIKASDGKFVKKQQKEIIDQMTDQGKLEKDFERNLFGAGNLEYNDLTDEEKQVVDAEVKRRQDLQLYRLDPEGFEQRKLQEEKMDTIRENMDNLDEPRSETVPEAIPEKDPEKISMGANMRNNAMDPKPLAMMAFNSSSSPSNTTNNSSTVVSNVNNVKQGGSGGSIGTRNADTSLYSSLAPAFMQRARG